jgi:U3 small nucleolar ribonucleoprotein component
MEQVEQFVVFMAAYELKYFIDENYETCAMANKSKSGFTLILDDCIINFSDNIYVVDNNKRGTAARESTNILQKDEDENISFAEDIDEDENEEAIVPPKHGDMCDPPTSPST